MFFLQKIGTDPLSFDGKKFEMVVDHLENIIKEKGLRK